MCPPRENPRSRHRPGTQRFGILCTGSPGPVATAASLKLCDIAETSAARTSPKQMADPRRPPARCPGEPGATAPDCRPAPRVGSPSCSPGREQRKPAREPEEAGDRRCRRAAAPCPVCAGVTSLTARRSCSPAGLLPGSAGSRRLGSSTCELGGLHCHSAPAPQRVSQTGLVLRAWGWNPFSTHPCCSDLRQQILFTVHHYLEGSLQQTPGSCCGI